MDKQIKFRGQLTDTKKWVFGFYFKHADIDRIFIPDKGSFTVIPETVGQLHNGLTKKAGQEVYVGDIIRHDLAEGLGEPLTLELKSIVDTVEMHYHFHINIVVIGNIHE